MGTVIDRYNENREHIQWFIDKYFPNKMIVLDEMAKDGKETELYSELMTIWFLLPDHIFNIINRPKGWARFLNIIEQ